MSFHPGMESCICSWLIASIGYKLGYGFELSTLQMSSAHYAVNPLRLSAPVYVFVVLLGSVAFLETHFSCVLLWWWQVVTSSWTTQACIHSVSTSFRSALFSLGSVHLGLGMWLLSNWQQCNLWKLGKEADTGTVGHIHGSLRRWILIISLSSWTSWHLLCWYQLTSYRKYWLFIMALNPAICLGF